MAGGSSHLAIFGGAFISHMILNREPTLRHFGSLSDMSIYHPSSFTRNCTCDRIRLHDECQSSDDISLFAASVRGLGTGLAILRSRFRRYAILFSAADQP